MPLIRVYTAPGCPWCKKAKAFLREKGLAFEEINVAANREALQELLKKTGRMAVPVLDIDGAIIQGYNVAKLEEALKSVRPIENVYDLVILGGGVSGLSAAIYAGRTKLKTAVVAEKLGGMIVVAERIENYPGLRTVSGLELTDTLVEQVREQDVAIIERRATAVERCEDGCFKVVLGEESLHTRALIFATGTEWRLLGVPGEDTFAGRGVHYCALCDGAFYKGKVLGVVGGSDSAVKEALLLAEYGSKVYLIYRGEKLRPEPANLQRVQEHEKIEVITGNAVVEIQGDEFVRSVVLKKPYQGTTELKLDALFVRIGHEPVSGLAQAIGVGVTDTGEIIIDSEGRTNVAGVFAAGDVVAKKLKQAVVSVAEGVTAAYAAYHYVHEHDLICLCDDEP
jgi:thioredoxin-disulfide reductase